MPSPSLPHPRDSSSTSPRLSTSARLALVIVTALAALVLLLLISGVGLSTWRGSGFRANGSELPDSGRSSGSSRECR